MLLSGDCLSRLPPAETAVLGILSGRTVAVSLSVLDKPAIRRHFVHICRTHAVHLLVADLLREHGGVDAAGLESLLQELESDKASRCAFLLAAEARACGIGKAFDDCGIPLCLLKGMALVHSVYATHPLWRCFGDIDILVPEERMDAAIEVFLQAGYRLAKHKRDLKAIRRYGHKVCFAGGGSAADIFDVHFRPLGKKLFDQTARLSTETFFTSSSSCRIRARTFTIPGHELHLLYLCVHFSLQHHLAGLNWLYDLKMFTDGTESLNWDSLVRRARDCRIQRAVWLSMNAARSVLDAAIPDGVLRDLSPGRRGVVARLWQSSRSDPGNMIAQTHHYRQRRMVGKFARIFSEVLLIDDRNDRWRATLRWLFPGPLLLRAAYRVQGAGRIALCYAIHPLVLLAMAASVLLATGGYALESWRRKQGRHPQWKNSEA